MTVRTAPKDETALPKIFTDDEMDTLVLVNLYEYDGEREDHATPNYRYCKPGTPCYAFDWDDQLWNMEAPNA